MITKHNSKINLIFFLLLFAISPGFSQLYFSETNIDTEGAGFKGMEPADMNNNGLFDIVLYNTGGLMVLENNGDGSFTEHFEESTHQMWNIRQVKIGDMEGDGDIDVFVCGDGLGHTLVWYRNNGNFNYEELPVHFSGSFYLLYDFVPFDADYDGDLDFLIAQTDDDPEVLRGQIAVYMNYDEFMPFPLGPEITEFLMASSVVIADFDLDGDRDVIANGVTEESLHFYRNDGEVPFTGTQIFNAGEDFLFDDLEVIYFDDDEIPDILTTDNETENIYIFELNDEELDTLEIIETAYNRTMSLTHIDLDNDGDKDLLGSAPQSSDLVWWEKDEDGFIEHIIDESTTRKYIRSYDIDDDGDLDIIGAWQGPDVTIWEQVRPYEISLTPWDEWIVIFPEGGHFRYDAFLQNNTEVIFGGIVWKELITPEGNRFNLQDTYPVELEAGEVIEVSPWQHVPGWAPPGVYTYIVNMGTDQENPVSSDSFQFWKMGPVQGTGELDYWNSGGWDLINYDEVVSTIDAVPVEYRIDNIYPNPFNSQTQITINIPEATILHLEIYDVLGRQVKQLAQSQYSAGYHSLTFNGMGLSSGLYFVNLIVPGEVYVIEKIILMK